jgi:hypothetical protein
MNCTDMNLDTTWKGQAFVYLKGAGAMKEEGWAAKKAGIYSKEKAPTTNPSTSLLSHFL